MPESKRLFVAVKIQPSADFLKVYNQIKSALRSERITWVNPANMHITIKFFGETSVHQIAAIDECLTKATKSFKAFQISVKKTGMFGSRYDPRVLWFGIEDGNAMSVLFERVSEELKTIGIHPDRQNFVPHLTIGRIKEIRDKKKYQQTLELYREHDSGCQVIDEVTLYESLLRREGPVHTPLKNYRLL